MFLLSSTPGVNISKINKKFKSWMDWADSKISVGGRLGNVLIGLEFFIPISRCFSIIFLWQMDELWIRSPEGIAQVSNYFGSCFSTLWMRGRSCMFLVPQVGSVSVCADLRLLCCSCFGGVSPVQLVFSVYCGCWWILVSICECAASL